MILVMQILLILSLLIATYDNYKGDKQSAIYNLGWAILFAVQIGNK